MKGLITLFMVFFAIQGHGIETDEYPSTQTPSGHFPVPAKNVCAIGVLKGKNVSMAVELAIIGELGRNGFTLATHKEELTRILVIRGATQDGSLLHYYKQKAAANNLFSLLFLDDVLQTSLDEIMNLESELSLSTACVTYFSLSGVGAAAVVSDIEISYLSTASKNRRMGRRTGRTQEQESSSRNKMCNRHFLKVFEKNLRKTIEAFPKCKQKNSPELLYPDN